MRSRTTGFRQVKVSLADLLGTAFVRKAREARAQLTGERLTELERLAAEKVDLYPKRVHSRLTALLPKVGRAVARPVRRSAVGAATEQFQANAHTDAAPLSAFGYYRVGEDGRLYLISKSEHYHVALGHSFPGFALLDRARRLGLPNATHNNTRGHITRTLEMELVRLAAGLARSDRAALRRVLTSERSNILNRVLNIQTGSLAAEAALKIVLSRFYRVQSDSTTPPYVGRVPVIVVVGDTSGDLAGNYHGTTVVGQLLRGMWPDFLRGLQSTGLLEVRAIRPNRMEDFERTLDECERPPRKVAAFFHELVMMNYAATRLDEAFVRRAYRLCAQRDIPTVVDEIQTCLWSTRLLMFHEYGVQPSVVVVGKGFSGGEYAASRLICTAELDRLPQFGALVTNGQEEISSLAYLVSIRWAEVNAGVITDVGQYYECRLRELADRYSQIISGIGGCRHLCSINFHELPAARKFVSAANKAGLDISVQTYKADCPPSALTKLPLIAGFEVVDAMFDRIEQVIESIDR